MSPIPYSMRKNDSAYDIECIGGTFYIATVQIKQDAEFIIKACNSHNALVEALKLLLQNCNAAECFKIPAREALKLASNNN